MASFGRVFKEILYSKNIFLYFSIFVILFFVTMAVFTDYLVPHSPYAMEVKNRLVQPDSNHWLGTDNYGRDVYSRIMLGTRVSLIIGVSVSLLSSIIGAFLGMIAATFRHLDNVVMRFLDGLMSFPASILAIGLIAVFGGGLWQEVIALTVVFSPQTARIMRGVTLRIVNYDFVKAAIVSGASKWHILRQHVLLNGFGPLVVQATFVLARSIIIDAGLSFLGLGVPSPEPTWGNMLGDAKLYMGSAWWFVTFPGLAIILTVMSINIIGDFLRDVLDPKLR